MDPIMLTGILGARSILLVTVPVKKYKGAARQHYGVVDSHSV